MRISRFRIVWLVAATLLSGIAACSGGEATAKNSAATAEVESIAASPAAIPADFARVEFAVEGMTCGGCEIGTRMALEKLDGVEDAGASYEDSRAWAFYDPSKVTPERMMAAIRELGYTPTRVESAVQS
ncbi:MAG TPA: cation transporter [Longimicrobiaceae bacterium]|nr:cation transporter [Longimicrobiaceae bacterium]